MADISPPETQDVVIEERVATVNFEEPIQDTDDEDKSKK